MILPGKIGWMRVLVLCLWGQSSAPPGHGSLGLRQGAQAGQRLGCPLMQALTARSPTRSHAPLFY